MKDSRSDRFAACSSFLENAAQLAATFTAVVVVASL